AAEVEAGGEEGQRDAQQAGPQRAEEAHEQRALEAVQVVVAGERLDIVAEGERPGGGIDEAEQQHLDDGPDQQDGEDQQHHHGDHRPEVGAPARRGGGGAHDSRVPVGLSSKKIRSARRTFSVTALPGGRAMTAGSGRATAFTSSPASVVAKTSISRPMKLTS